MLLKLCKMEDTRVEIWRIENLLGVGPYQSSDLDFLLEHGRDRTEHPGPQNDKAIKRWCEPGEICGFKDRKQMLQWFNIKQLKALRAEGFMIKRIKVQKITALGEKQVLAIK